MAIKQPDFTIGVEEEYLLVDLDSYALADAPEELMERCASALEDQVSPEFLNCQIEIGTQVCNNVGEAREDLKRLRSTVAREAKAFNLAPIAASCHPFAEWRKQRHTDKERYNTLQNDLAGVASRMLICGMHVHVGIESPDMRIDLVNQFKYFLPHLLALSCSSPFWQGQDTGLSSYRLTVFDNVPRTGLPARFESWAEYERSVEALIQLGILDDATKIWWDIRPSARFPTIESRICDVMPRLEHTLTLAALIQCIARMLWRLARNNQRWRIYDNMLIAENRWRAQRYGMSDGMIDFGTLDIKPFDVLLKELFELIGEDAEALGCHTEMLAAQDILDSGNSATHQRRVYSDALHAGYDHRQALNAVVRHLIEDFHHDL